MDDHVEAAIEAASASFRKRNIHHAIIVWSYMWLANSQPRVTIWRNSVSADTNDAFVRACGIALLTPERTPPVGDEAVAELRYQLRDYCCAVVYRDGNKTCFARCWWYPADEESTGQEIAIDATYILLRKHRSRLRGGVRKDPFHRV